MSYQKALIEFMKAKNVVVRAFNSKFTYFKTADAKLIKAWSDDDAKEVWDTINVNVKELDSDNTGLSDYTCPFCALVLSKCWNCEYRNNRDDINCYDDDSIFQREYVDKADVHKAVDKVLNKTWFKKTLKEISDKYKLK